MAMHNLALCDSLESCNVINFLQKFLNYRRISKTGKEGTHQFLAYVPVHTLEDFCSNNQNKNLTLVILLKLVQTTVKRWK